MKTIQQFIKDWENIKDEDITFSEYEWEEISSCEYLSEKFMEKYKSKINWYCISQYQPLSEEFIEKYKDRIHWYCISECQQLSEEFIEKHKDRVDWYWISQCQKLSEEFIEKYKDRVDWYWISYCQSLSEEFIYRHQDKISHPNCLYKYYRLRYNNNIFSIYANNNYGLILKWKDQGFDIQNTPFNIIFCQTL